MDVSAGTRPALGATREEGATRFSVWAGHATGVDLCLFDRPEDLSETRRVPLESLGGGVWEVRVDGAGAGQLYGYRARGPWRPAEGHRYNPAKLLVDPRARAITGPVRWNGALCGQRADLPDEPDARDSAPFVPRCVVVDPAFDWRDDRPPAVPWSRTVLYECHVKGLTRLHPEVPEEQRGRYLGLAAPAVVEHLRSLGVTTLSLMPVHHCAIDAHVARLGLVNYWGYSTLGFFAPDARFATSGLGAQAAEFKAMVRELHRAELEVVIDVVYNHTAEGEPRGATLCLRGLDNACYYRLHPERPAEYVDFTGCGNTLDLRRAPALELVLESLRFWVEEMHVDGFRFDLAPALARDPVTMSPEAPFLAAVAADPVLSRVKLIAEPWDLGPGGYQLGRFPAGWAEWNGRFRDVVRDLWRSDSGRVGLLAQCLAGSRDLFESKRAGPHAGVSYVTCHDGFTLRDLVSYERKHNEANGEQNRDGANDNRSRNWGVEGPTEDRRVTRLRERARHNLVATLALSQGVPMLSHGDELGRTQRGNNNAYCHDDESVWVDWTLDEAGASFLAFVRDTFALRAGNAVFRRRRFLSGAVDAEGRKDVLWLHPDGREMTPADWDDAGGHTLAMLIPAESADPADEAGTPQTGVTALLLMNGGARSRRFRLPVTTPGTRWREVLHSACPWRREGFGENLVLAPHSMVVLELEHDEPPA
jgi:isoamylase